MQTSTPAPSQSAPMGGFFFVIFSSIDETFGNRSLMPFTMRPATCSSNFDGIAISSFSPTHTSLHSSVYHQPHRSAWRPQWGIPLSGQPRTRPQPPVPEASPHERRRSAHYAEICIPVETSRLDYLTIGLFDDFTISLFFILRWQRHLPREHLERTSSGLSPHLSSRC